MIKRLIQRFCNHNFVKTWNRAKNGYAMQCTKCGKIND